MGNKCGRTRKGYDDRQPSQAYSVFCTSADALKRPSANVYHNRHECMVRGNELIIRPAKTASGGEFAEQILADLIAKGLSGNELLAEFKNMQKKIRPAVAAMLSDAHAAAKGDSESLSYDDVFGSEEKK